MPLARASRLNPALALLSASTDLDRPDSWHRAQARQRLQERFAWTPRPGTPADVADALAGQAAAWDARVLAEHDAAWARTLLPLERGGAVDARRVVARATLADRDAMCVGPRRPAAVAFREWRLRNPVVVDAGGRAWTGRHLATGAAPDGSNSFAARRR